MSTEIIIKGIGVSEGIKIGKVLKYVHEENKIEFQEIDKELVQEEIERFLKVKEQYLKELEDLIDKTQKEVGIDKANIFKGYKAILFDPAFTNEIIKIIETKFFSSEKAIDEIVNKFVTIFENMPNEYMKERAADIKSVGNSLLLLLSNKKGLELSRVNEKVVLVSDDLSPTDTVQLNKEYIIAFVTQKGGKTSHTAILARTLGIPAVVGIGDKIKEIKNGDIIIIDAYKGLCIINPEERTINEYKERIEIENNEQLVFNEYRFKNAITKDKFKVKIMANIGSVEDAVIAKEYGCEGIGLFRTELIYMTESGLPDENKQFQIYKDVAKIIDSDEVIIRTLDIGGDKELPYLKLQKENNPFLGYRAIRLCLDRKEIFITQLRAILKASQFGNIKILFPMISEIDELKDVKNILEETKQQLKDEGFKINNNIEIGIMIEVPSAALMAEYLINEVDFFSIGTNDLVQYTLAVDRMNEKVSYLYNHFNPAIIRLTRNITQIAHSKGKYVEMCGGMAEDPLAIPLLIALGIDKLSISSGSIPKIKYIINNLDMSNCKLLLNDILKLPSTKEIQLLLEDFYKNNLKY